MSVLLECCGNNNIKDITMDNNDKLLLKLLNVAHPIGAPINDGTVCNLRSTYIKRENKIGEKKRN